MTGSRIAISLGAAFACAIFALVAVPLGFEANTLLNAQNDPVRLVDHELDRTFNATVVDREIKAALAADDIDLANSFLELARDRNVSVDSALIRQIEAANSTAAAAKRAAGSFGRGLITGEPDSMASFAGTAVGDLFVFGDIRDALREGSRLAAGESADELILGLACFGLVVTAGTYATLGVGAPLRVGVSLLKAAGKTGRLTVRMGAWLGRSLREAIDAAALKRAVTNVSLTNPSGTVRALREAVKVEKTTEITRLVGDLGRVQGKAGTQAALDGLKLAEGPRDVSRIARLADVKGTKTRAVLKMFGRGALFLTTSAINLFLWLMSAIMTVFGFCSSCKRIAERATERYIAHRKARRLRAQQQFLAMTTRAAAVAAA